MPRIKSAILFRCVAVLTAFSLAFSASANGLYWSATELIKAAQEFQRSVAPRPGPYTDQPTEIYYGDNPGRDEDHRGGLWTDAQLESFQKEVQENQVKWGAAAAAIHGRTALFSFVGSGAGEAMPWERTLGSVNTSTGNKSSEYPIVSWPIRGGGNLEFTLRHSSKSNISTAAGYAWRMSYDLFVEPTYNDLDQQTGANVTYDDGTTIPFSYNRTTHVYTAPAGIYDVLTEGAGGTYVLTLKDQTKWNFDSSGRSVSWVDRAGNNVTIGHDGAGRINLLTDPSGRTLAITYDASSRIRTITDPTSRLWTITHNAGGDLTDIAYPALSGVIYNRVLGFDAGHNITSEVDLRGKTWTWGYDTNDSLTSETNPLSQTTTYSYTASSCTMTLPGGQTSTDNYSSGRIASRVDAASFSTAYTSYDSNKNPLSITDKRGKVWQFTYDSKGNVLTKKDPLLHTWTYTYNGSNDLLTSKDPLNNTTTMTYNSAGGVLTVTDPLSRVVETNTYNGYRQRLTTKNAMNEQSSFGYNTNGDCTSITDPLSKQTTLAFDSLGRVTSVTDPLLHATSTAYDEWGRPTSITFAGGTSVSRSYDREDNVTSEIDENGHQKTSVYDNAGGLTSVTNARGDVESYGYNSNRWRTSVTNGRGYTRSYVYTSRGEVYSLTMPDSTLETWSYNANGDTSGYTNPLNQTISYLFDDAGRQTTVDYPTGTDTTFGYDNANRRISMLDSTGTTTWTFNAASEQTQLATPQGTMSYTYQISGRRATMVEVGVGTTTYGYDSAGHLTSLQNPFLETTTFAYDDDGRLTQKTFASGAYTQLGYDSRDRTTSISHKKSDGTVLSSESYVYDSAGNLISRVVVGTTTTYGYDVVDQLTSESRSGYSASYTYDANGNRTSKTLNGSTDTYTVDANDKLLSIALGGGGTKSYGYDAAGRTTSVTTSAGVTALAYDYEGRITSITYPNLITSISAYNGFDARTSTADNVTSRTYKRDGVTPTDPVLADGATQYTPGISERRATISQFINADRLGSTTELTDSGQLVTDTNQYDAYGVLVASTGSTPSHSKFAGWYGYQTDYSSSITLVGHRYLDCSTGRFITKDPAKDGPNWYSYGRNNPLLYVDPTGLEIPEWLQILSDGLDTGLHGAASGLTWGLYDGGPHKYDPGFGTSQGLGKIGLIALSAAALEFGAVRLGLKGPTIIRVGLHDAHHFFGRPFFRKMWHLQVNIWEQGVKGSGKVWRVPLWPGQ